jgi:hypothetical protein
MAIKLYVVGVNPRILLDTAFLQFDGEDLLWSRLSVDRRRAFTDLPESRFSSGTAMLSTDQSDPVTRARRPSRDAGF